MTPTHAKAPPAKRQKRTSISGQLLLPGLPDHVAQLILSLLPPSLIHSVAYSWRRVLYTPSFPPFLSLYTLSRPRKKNSPSGPNPDSGSHQNTVSGSNSGSDSHQTHFGSHLTNSGSGSNSDSGSHQTNSAPHQTNSGSGSNSDLGSHQTNSDFHQIDSVSYQTNSGSHDTNSFSLWSFNPVSSTWQHLPPPPDTSFRPIFKHTSFVSRYLPVQSASVSGNLVLFAASAENLVPAFSRPLIFNPESRTWGSGPRMFSPRRWCVGGSCGGVLYVASGVGAQYTSKTARSVEKLDFFGKKGNNWGWEKLGDLESERMSREAMGAVGWRGNLLVADVTAKEGFMYDIRKDMWCEMPKGMIGGWRGPAAAMDEETLFMVDESKGILRRYNAGKDCWEDVLWAKELRGAEQIAAGGGRVCVVRSSGDGIIVVDVVVSPARFWTVDTPDGSQPIAVHILPRISQFDL